MLYHSVLLALTLGACSSAADNIQNSAQPVHARQQASAQYLLHPTDQIRVQVYGEADISGEYAVDGSGYVSIPLAGRIKAAGKAVGTLERDIASRLNSGQIKQPRVNVQIVRYAPFYIHGEVKKSGEFPYRPGMTVMDAVATAGGFTYRADEANAFVRRYGAEKERVYPLSSRVPIHPGDNVRIGERYF